MPRLYPPSTFLPFAYIPMDPKYYNEISLSDEWALTQRGRRTDRAVPKAALRHWREFRRTISIVEPNSVS